MNSKLTLLLFVLISFFSFEKLIGQGTNLPNGDRAYQILDRLQIKTGLKTPYHNSIQPIIRGHAVGYCLDLLEQDSFLSGKDKYDIQYIFDGSNEWLNVRNTPTTLIGGKSEEPELLPSSESSPYYTKRKKPLLKSFYKTPGNLFEVNKPDFHFRVNPILNLAYANSKNDTEPVFLNQRGIEFRGGVDDRIFFYSNILETQARFPNYVTDRIQADKAIPGAGLFKNYNSSVFDITNGYDFLNAQAYLGFNVTKHVGVQLGHGKNFIGNGYRSLLLSDFANNYYHLKFDWNVWRFQFQNIFAEVTAGAKTGPDALLPKKYLAAHYLNYNFTPNLSVGFFEAVVFNRNNNFEFQYLNPVILYRTVEQMIGSPDNVLIGLNGNWNFLNRFQLYGQLILDEFKFDELVLDNQGWWANKYGYQVGIKYVDAFGVDHLDLQFETNTVRPYTYTHFDSSSVYTHFNQPLAHPLGANFQEFIGIIRYQPLNRLALELKVVQFKQGEDTNGENWGNNILLPSSSRQQEYGNELFQGVEQNTLLVNGLVSYELFHNCFIDLQYFQRSKDSFSDGLDLETMYVGGGFRLNASALDFNY